MGSLIFLENLMIAVILTETQHEYLVYLFEKCSENGMFPPSELKIAATTWDAISNPQKFDLPPAPEKEVQVIDGPVSVALNGDMAIPISPEDAQKLL
jgi:hypothetical protein